MLIAHEKFFVPEHLAGRSVTLLNFFSIGGVGLFQYISGLVFSGNAHKDLTGQYQSLFAFYALILTVALIIYAFSKDAKPGEKYTV